MPETGGTYKLGVVMNVIADINPGKDTTLGLMEAAQRRGWQLTYFEQADLYLRDGCARGCGRRIKVALDTASWFSMEDQPRDMDLQIFDAILMRVDPPVDLEFLHTCEILEYAGRAGTIVVNDPLGIRTANEKIVAQRFPDLSPPTLVSGNDKHLLDFVNEQNEVVLKPLNRMGGAGIIRTRADDPGLRDKINTMTERGRCSVMAQTLIENYAQGDKRILMIDGKPVPRTLTRIPPHGKFCANLAAGGRGEGSGLSARDAEICRRVAPLLSEMGLLFVGLDVIAGYLTEINVTSPTCMRELNKLFRLDIGAEVIETIETKLR